MKKLLTLLCVFVLALTLIGCGGSGTGSGGSASQMSGNWFANGFQLHDDGSVTEVSFDTLTINNNGTISGTYAVSYYPMTGEPQLLESGQFTGTNESSPYGEMIDIHFPGENRGGVGPRSLVTMAQVDRTHNYAMGFAGASDIGPEQYRETRPDYFFGMHRYQGGGRAVSTERTREAALERYRAYQQRR